MEKVEASKDVITSHLEDTYESLRDKTYEFACATNEYSDQSRHPSSLIRTFESWEVHTEYTMNTLIRLGIRVHAYSSLCWERQVLALFL